MLPTAEESAFRRAIHAEPENPAPCLIFADWLEEQGDYDRADLLRTQADPRIAVPDVVPHLFCRSRVLEAIVRRREPFPTDWKVGYRRGLPAELDLPAAQFLAQAQAVRRHGPWEVLRLRAIGGLGGEVACEPALSAVQELDLSAAEADEVSAIVGSPHLDRLSGLRFRLSWSQSVGRTATLCARLAGNPMLANLTMLSIGGPRSLEPFDMQHIADSAILARVRRLHVPLTLAPVECLSILLNGNACRHLEELRITSATGITMGDGYRIIAESPRVAGLRVLDLNGLHLTRGDVAVLISSRFLRDLEELHLDSRLEDRVAAGLGAGPTLAKLRRLTLNGGNFKPATWSLLGSTNAFPNLFDLRMLRVRNPEVRTALARAPLLSRPAYLHLIGSLGMAELRYLVERDDLTNLRGLSLRGCQLGASAEMLTTAPWLGRLEYLDLSETAIGLGTLRRILSALPTNRLRWLGLRNETNEYGSELHRILAHSALDDDCWIECRHHPAELVGSIREGKRSD